MTSLPAFEELTDLVWALANDRLDLANATRLNELLHADRRHVRVYLRLLDQFAALEWEHGEGRPHGSRKAHYELPQAAAACLPSLPIVLDLSATVEPSARPFFVGTTVFCYAVSAIIVLVGLVVARFSFVPLSHPVAHSAIPVVSGSKEDIRIPQYAAQVTGMVDCQLISPATGLAEGANIALGQVIELQSGVMEITYLSGAKVILAGRTRYLVDDREGGYLALGKLAARVERPSIERNSASPTAGNATTPQALFAVRTPSSIVTDLGTEFGVEVDESGASEAHVFQGKVEVRATQPKSKTSDRAVTLRKNESARIAATPSAQIVVEHDATADRFIRRLPKRVRLPLVNTGYGQQEGEADQHWQIVARSDDPKFKPQAAVVATIPIHHLPDDAPGVGHLYMLPNDPGRSQWISLQRSGEQPGDVTFTFRTTFELSDVQVNTAVLRGRFIVDDHISEIRLNGKKLDVPSHEWSWVFFTWSEFQATSGFVDGKNVLEIDVFNGPETGAKQDDSSGMSLRVELEGWALPKVKQAKPAARPTAIP